MKKGFTLVEVLGVIVLLGILTSIVYVSVNKILKKSKEDAYAEQLTVIENAAKQYAIKNIDILPAENSNSKVYMHISLLKKLGFLKNEDILNPKDNSILNDCILITSASNKYKYEYKPCLTSGKTTFVYDYTGESQTFSVPLDGTYKMELWGAKGGGTSGGKGAYVLGTIALEKNTIFYVYVGLGNSTLSNKKTFNNGTSDCGGHNGGGSTDIRLVNGTWDAVGSINSRIMVAAGGGSSSGSAIGGYGGGLIGNAATGTPGGSQTAAGARQTNSYAVSYFGIANGGCSGGNGYYPGGGATCASGAGGGSSYISGYTGCVAITSATNTSPKSGCTNGTTNINCSYHYSGKIFSNTQMIAGNSSMPNPNGTGTNVVGNSGNGYAKITLETIS